MKIKVIDLLNKIAKGEEVPEKIRYNAIVYQKDNDGDIDFYIGNNHNGTLFLEKLGDTNELNDEIEIIEEKPKKIEELTNTIEYFITYEDERLKEDISLICKRLITNIDKINELTKAVNYLLEKESDK